MVKPVAAAKDTGTTAELLAQAKKVFSRAMVEALRQSGHDFIEAGGEGSFVRDLEGREYLDSDGSGGTFNLGRLNPALVEELREASKEVDQGNFVMISEEKAKLAARLSAFVPGDLHCALFTVVRGEPIDAACKLARGATGRTKLVTVDGGFYGDTGFAMSLSEGADHDAFGPLIPEVTTIPFGEERPAARAIGKTTAAVVIEPVQSENGCRRASPEYLRRLRRICDRKGALLIVDETVTGFGRTGTRFAFEQAGITPDIVVLGEAMGGGLFPMTALLFTRRLKAFFDSNPLIHLCTFGGHDIGCRVARRAMDEYDRIRPWELARLRGAALRERMIGLLDEHPELMLGVEGEGLLLALRLDSEEAAVALCRHAREEGLLLRQGRLARDTVVLRPSLLLTDNEIEALVKALDASLARISKD